MSYPDRMDTVSLGILTIIVYLGTAVLLGLRLARGRGRVCGLDKGPLVALGLVAAVLHGFILYSGMRIPGGLDLGFFVMLSLVTWLMAVVLLLTALRTPVENLGIAILPVTALGLGLQLALPGTHDVMRSVNPALDAHIVASILAFSLLGIAAAQAALLAVQDYHLRNRQPGGFVRALPPLETMERLLFQIILLGFLVLTVALLLGFLYLEDIFAQHLVHKTVLSIAAWAVFGLLLWGRWRYGWRGRTAIRWTTTGLLVLVTAYFGSKLVLELVLGR